MSKYTIIQYHIYDPSWMPASVFRVQCMHIMQYLPYSVYIVHIKYLESAVCLVPVLGTRYPYFFFTEYMIIASRCAKRADAQHIGHEVMMKNACDTPNTVRY